MPVTIGNMTSNVNVVDSNGTISDAVMEQIIRQVLVRLKQEMYDQEKSRSEQGISDHRVAKFDC
jgi:hypothetical protein